MARRSLLKMYNKVLDNMEVPNPLQHNNYVNSKLSNSEPEDPSFSADTKCFSSYDVNKTNYNSDSTFSKENRRGKKGQFSPMRSDSNPYIAPKFHLRRKEELPSVTPHWSTTTGMELQESVPTVLNGEEYNNNSFARTKSFIGSGGGGSRINSNTNSQTGPYTPPQFFFSPQKYIETSRKKNDFLVSLDNKIPPSLQSWANQKPSVNQETKELQDLLMDMEEEKSVQRLRGQRMKENHKTKAAVSEQRIKQFQNNDRYNKSDGYRGSNTKSSHEKNPSNLKCKSKELKHCYLSKAKQNFSTRVNEDGISSGKKYKKLNEKSRNTSHCTDTWRQVLDHRLNEKLKNYEKKPKQVYGNDTWRQHRIRSVQKQEKETSVSKPKETISKKQVYGNETWKNSITNRNKVAKTPPENEIPAKKPKRYFTAKQMDHKTQSHKVQEKVSKETKTKSNEEDSMKDEINVDDDDTLVMDDKWEDIEPYLPSFLSTINKDRLKERKKSVPLPQQIKILKSKAITKKENKSKGRLSATVDNNAKEETLTKVKRACRCFFNPVVKPKIQEESISLFKHFQARSKILRKQHSMQGRKKELLKNATTLSAKNDINYYIPEHEFEQNETENKKEEDHSFRLGTLCDIDDDGFKVSHSNVEVDFVPHWHENRQEIDKLLGYDGTFLK